jgi:dolichol-phosphate mannosyltransferase
MQSEPRVLVAIPTYNERSNIEPLLALFREIPGEFDILFVDDNSPDGTAELIESLQKDQPHLKLLKRPSKLGIGSAHRDAIRYAYEHGYTTFATMDADLTHNPHSLARLLERAEHADIVVGSRYLLARSLPGWNLFRKTLTNVGHLMTRFFLKMPYDATGALRVYNLKTIPAELFGMVRSSGYSFLYESLFILWTNGCRVLEVPIELPARTYGSSKMSYEQIFISVFRLALLYTNIRLAPDLYRYKDTPLPASSGVSSWDRYWGQAHKERATDLLFEICATWVRRVLIRPSLDRVMRAQFREGQRVLHAGCGSGQVDLGLRHWLDITACDFSAGAVAMYAQVNAPYCQVRQADILQLPFGDGEFDGVYNLGVMEHFTNEEIQRALSEFYRVLKPGGKVVIFWPPETSPMGLALKLFHWAARRVDTRVKDPLYPPEISRTSSREQGERWLRAAGFRPRHYEFGVRDLYLQRVFVASKE